MDKMYLLFAEHGNIAHCLSPFVEGAGSIPGSDPNKTLRNNATCSPNLARGRHIIDSSATVNNDNL